MFHPLASHGSLRLLFIRKAMMILCFAAVAGCSAVSTMRHSAPAHILAGDKESRLAQRLKEPITAHPGLSGCYLLPSGMDAFVSRVMLAGAAEHTIDLQYFIIRNDTTTRLIFEALLRAADRGVRVRLLADDIHTGGPELGIDKLIAHPNIQVRVFHPFRHRGFGILKLPWDILIRPVNVSQRMHNKMFVVDNQAAIIGGRNLSDSYFEAEPNIDFMDLDMLNIGPVVQALTRCFDDYWESRWAVPIGRVKFLQPTLKDLENVRQSLSQTKAEAAQSAYITQLRQSDLLRRLEEGRLPFVWGPASVIYDHPSKVSGENDGESQPFRLEPFTRQAKTDIFMISPYFIPGKPGARQLVQLRERGVRVRILTNSAESTDIPAANVAYSRYRRALLGVGVEFYELKPTADYKDHRSKGIFHGSSQSSLHAKAYVFDMETVVIGSFNIDPRSRELNTELGVVVQSPELARQMKALFEAAIDPRNSYRVELAPPRHKGGIPGLAWISSDANGREIRLFEEPGISWQTSVMKGALWLLPLEGVL